MYIYIYIYIYIYVYIYMYVYIYIYADVLVSLFCDSMRHLDTWILAYRKLLASQ